MLTEQQRLQQILTICCDGKQSNFAKKMGISQQAGNSWFQNGTYNANKLAAAFTDISPEWLLRGTGKMFVYEQEQDEDMALDILHLSYDDLEAFRKWKSSHTDNKGTRTYEQTEPQCYQLSDGEAVDRALINMLLAEKPVLEQKIATLEHRNLELEKLNARLEERFAGATAWYFSAISQHPDLKK